jgi:hypothetical protein
MSRIAKTGAGTPVHALIQGPLIGVGYCGRCDKKERFALAIPSLPDRMSSEQKKRLDYAFRVFQCGHIPAAPPVKPPEYARKFAPRPLSVPRSR